MKIHEVVKLLRIEKGVTQKVLADALNIEPPSYSRLENGISEFRVSQLEVVASVLDVRIIDLFTYPVKYEVPSGERKYRKISLTLDLTESDFDSLIKLINK